MVKSETKKPAAKTSQTKPKEGKNKDKVDKPKPNKDAIQNKSINVPVMRCVTQLKILLNKTTKNKLDELKESNKEYFEKEKDYNTTIRKLPNDPKVDKDDKDAKIGPKKTLQNEFKAWKTNDENGELSKEIQTYRKKLYRISGPASKYISQILELVIKDMLKYGINVSTENTVKGRNPKLESKNFKNISGEDLLVYPLISGLKIMEDLNNDNEHKKEDDSGDEQKDEKKDKKPPSYQMVVHNMFRQFMAEDTDKKQCSKPCKFFISDVLMEFVERQAFYLSELVGNNAQASTVSEKHVLSTCRLLFYNVHRNLDQYGKFEETIEKMYNTRFPTKEEKEKTKKGKDTGKKAKAK